jgi:hypothetical protein
MKIINPHSLLSKPETIEVEGVILQCFNAWKILSRKNKAMMRIPDAFVAGYFLGSNSQLKSKYLQKLKDSIENELS